MNTHLAHTLHDLNGYPAATIEERLSQLPDRDFRELIRDGVVSLAGRITSRGWGVIRSC